MMPTPTRAAKLAAWAALCLALPAHAAAAASAAAASAAPSSMPAMWQLFVLFLFYVFVYQPFFAAGAKQPVDDEDKVSPMKDFRKKHAPPRQNSTPTTTSVKMELFMWTPLQDIGIQDVPGVGPATLARLAKHDYVSIKTGEQLFGLFLYKGRGEEFRTWLKDDCEVQGSVAKQLHEACLDKANKVCSTELGGGGGVAARGRTQTTTQVWNRTPIQDVEIRDVPGVGEKTAPLLARNKNITTGEQLFGFFLYLGRDEDRFRSWLKNECEVQGSAAARICNALAERAREICAL